MERSDDGVVFFAHDVKAVERQLHQAIQGVVKLRDSLEDTIEAGTVDEIQLGLVTGYVSALQHQLDATHTVATCLVDSAEALRETHRGAATAQQIAEARDLYGEEGELEIDDDAQLSLGRDSAWVQAWVKLPDAGGTD